MIGRLDRDGLARMMNGAAARIRAEHAWLSMLDSAVGDGDHGTTMLRIAERIEKKSADLPWEPFKAWFSGVGWSVMETDGGASSSLLGLFFLGMADALNEQASSLDARELAEAFAAGLSAVGKQTAARRGDKTMMDALIPAVDAFRAAAGGGKTMAAGMQEATHAAKEGAESTREMAARQGRARFLGEKSRGHEDPGSASIALIFEGFYIGLTDSAHQNRKE